ncbi:unnamed protein product [Euphydryas editha]|uniref:Uncharacterized protein n=1 Tax=Euphydryas editha TaxID=104508 RepID=A0AAU9TKC3_EUPED|nr:unnamed protein product [Euphydryas editha]
MIHIAIRQNLSSHTRKQSEPPAPDLEDMETRPWDPLPIYAMREIERDFGTHLPGSHWSRNGPRKSLEKTNLQHQNLSNTGVNYS